MGDRAKGTVKVKVKITDSEVEEVNNLAEKRFRLFPEMAATAHFIGEGKEAQGGKVEPQVYAPANAIQKSEQGDFAWVVVQGQLKRTSVEVGDTREGRVLILRGLTGGEQVVLDPPATLQVDLAVNVLQ
jgi:hypothetical protein